jgi:hypothetical protein
LPRFPLHPAIKARERDPRIHGVHFIRVTSDVPDDCCFDPTPPGERSGNARRQT